MSEPAAANYEEAVRALLALGRELAAPRQPRVQKWGLANITALAESLGNPHLAIPCAHIAGTNGKGSTAAMLEAILRSAGWRTGLYTSPHLERVNERIRIAGRDISDQDFAAAWNRAEAAAESLLASGGLAAHPTFFECMTAMAFDAFARAQVEVAIYEVGLGGRLDATNILLPQVTVITPIDFDHENYLGHSIAEIAAEKAGIIKRGCPLISAPQRPEARDLITRRCAEMNARLTEVGASWAIENVEHAAGRYRGIGVSRKTGRRIAFAPRLPGRFQLQNALTAAAAALALAERGLSIPQQAIERGIADADWPGRLERIAERPMVYLDGAHNPAGARELAKFWEENFRGKRILLVYGAMRDKPVDEIAGILFPLAESVILTQPSQPRAISAPLLAEMTADLSPNAEVLADPGAALERAIALARPDGAVFATGSLYLVGDLKQYWRRR